MKPTRINIYKAHLTESQSKKSVNKYAYYCSTQKIKRYYGVYQIFIRMTCKINANSTVSLFFDQPAPQWGLRGDENLWGEMKEKLQTTPIPSTIFEFEELLFETFKDLTGESAKKRNNIFIDRYVSQGLSSNTVSSPFWVKTLFPLLLQRYRQAMN